MRKIKKVIYIISMSFYKRDYERFGIEILKNNGFEVELWNISDYLYPKASNNADIPDPFIFPGYRSFASINEIKAAIRGLDESCFIISLCQFDQMTYKLFQAISRKNIKYAISIVGSSYPGIAPDSDSYQKPSYLSRFIRIISKKIKINDIKNRIIMKVFRNIPLNWLGIHPVDIVISCTSTNIGSCSCPTGGSTEFLYTHYFDYDVYLGEQKEPFEVNKQIGVFLDENVPFCTDWIFAGVSAPLKPEEYYPSLCRYFDNLEKKYAVKIVIAAHPRSNYEQHPDYFGGRKIVLGKTANIVKKAGFVIAHHSYSTNYAVLFKKPVLFITTDRIDQTFMRRYIDKMAKSLDRRVINIDKNDKLDWEKEMAINEKMYDKYKDLYIKMKGTKEMPLWQIVADRLKQY